MIIDSHAHYSHRSFSNSFKYLSLDEQGYCIKEGDRGSLLQELFDAGIEYSIEPGVSIERNQEVLELCREYQGRIFPSIGVHPNKAVFEKWSARKILVAQAHSEGVVAIGEIGLDYHLKREEQHRFRQFVWFWYQLGLAKRLNLPVMLHVRDAHKDALIILRCHSRKKYTGVIHCFNGTWDEAKQYLDLGFHLGIGGSILQQEERASDLWEVVKHTPLERILIETDAPYILPYCKNVIQPKLLRRARNTSMILPKVIEKIAELKGLDAAEIEKQTTENTIKLFGLNIEFRGSR